MNRLFRLLLSLFLPTIVVVASVFLYFWFDFSTYSEKLVLNFLPYGIFFIGMILSFKFNRSRVFFILLTALLSLATLQYLYDDLFKAHPYNTALYLLVGILIPLNLLVFSTFKERGFFTTWGVLRFVLIAGEFYFITSLLVNPTHKALGYLYREYWWNPFSAKFPELVGIILGASLILMLMKMYLAPTYFDSSFVAGLMICGFILLLQDTNGLLILFSTLGILLVISIIQDSYRMSYLDDLTELPGRRALKEQMMKLSGLYTIAMLDIDHFKKFNDKHGHDVGDEVLAMVASILKEVSGGGKAFRYGGEEFTILFPNKGSKDALPHLETLRETIENRIFVVRSKEPSTKKPPTTKKKPTTRKTPTGNKTTTPAKRLKVTISIGVAARTKETKSPHDVLKNADKALYRAKNKGRNCVSK